MSETDSFIAEVTEEVRRDRFMGYLRRYGWIAALIILGVVGGTAWNEYRKAQAEAIAEARGDAIAAAMNGASVDDRVAALSAQDGLVEAFMIATELQAAGRTEEASEALAALAEMPDIQPLYRDLANIKRLNIDPNIPAEERSLMLSVLSSPGAPYRTVAQEIIGLDLVSAGETEAAIEAFQSLINDADASDAQRERLARLIFALGGTPELANSLLGGSSDAPLE
ncbi:MAG: hypothetical protein AAGA47_01515 [Pseudomonadota bacterium]